MTYPVPPPKPPTLLHQVAAPLPSPPVPAKSAVAVEPHRQTSGRTSVRSLLASAQALLNPTAPVTSANFASPDLLPRSLLPPASSQRFQPQPLGPRAQTRPFIPVWPQPTLPPSPALTPAPPTPQLNQQGILELRADQQDYDQQRQVFTAQGRVSLKFRGALLTADRLQVNLLNRLAVAEGNVRLTRGSQLLQGQRFRYNLVQEAGTIEAASGEIFIPAAQTDFNPNLPTDITAGIVPLTPNQPAQDVNGRGGAGITLGSRRSPSGAPVVPPPANGTVRRLRFQAQQIEFYPEGWQARQVRITNDPFSPPELELQASQAELKRISPLRDELLATRPQLVFDRRVKLPLFRRRAVLDRTQRSPALVNFGFDTNDRGGVFIERRFDILPPGATQLSLTPQFYVQRAFQKRDNFADLFGVKTRFSTQLSPRTRIRGDGILTSLNLNRVQDNLRGSLRAQQLVGTHTLSLEASYRDRLFNNSLGFQDVQTSLGALFFSPTIALGKTGINLSYQVGYQYVNADTDRADLLPRLRSNNRIGLGRLQASAALSRGFMLWQGRPLPATQTSGLRYSPTPVIPYLGLVTGLTGVASSYSNGDRQNNLNASVGLVGQLGHFSRDWFDYTRFNLTYSQIFRDGLSPFLFDRVADDRILSAGLVQQIYGPLRAGIQTSYNVQTGREISTDYILEYNRRSYSVGLRYNPILKLGSINLQISDFNWTGGTSEPFEGGGVVPVQGGIRQAPE